MNLTKHMSYKVMDVMKNEEFGHHTLNRQGHVGCVVILIRVFNTGIDQTCPAVPHDCRTRNGTHFRAPHGHHHVVVRCPLDQHRQRHPAPFRRVRFHPLIHHTILPRFARRRGCHLQHHDMYRRQSK